MTQENQSELQWLEKITPLIKQEKEYQSALGMQWLNSRMEDSGIARCLALIQREAQMEKEFQERTDHAAIVNERARKEIALAQEISELRQKEICELQRRHQLRQNDPELRNLIRKLQAGYTNRDLKQQILHNEYKKLQEKAEAARANATLRDALMNDKEQLEYEDRLHMEKTSRYRQELQQQMVNKQQQKQCQYEDMLIEKKMLDDVIKTIYDEDMRELQQKRALKERTRAEMEKSALAREGWRLKQKTLVLNEETAIERQLAELGDRSRAIVEERIRRQKAREESNEKIAKKIFADTVERRQRQEFIMNLQEQEYLEKNIQDDVAEAERVERTRRDTLESLDAMTKRRLHEAEEARVRDLEIRKKNEEELREQDRKEQEKERAKRERGRQYSRELMQQMEQNRKKREEQKRDEQQRDKYVVDCHNQWSEKVSAERKKIIMEHVPPIIGYLQAAVVTPEDLDTVKEGCQKSPQLAHLDIDRLRQSGAAAKHPKCNAQCVKIKDY